MSFFQQIGRSCCSENDVVQTKKHSEVKQETQERSTISRYSCRSLVDREPSRTANVFAARFDKSNNIFLGVCKPAICLYLKNRISPTETILSHVTALKGRLLPNDDVVEHTYIHTYFIVTSPKGLFRTTIIIIYLKATHYSS